MTLSLDQLECHFTWCPEKGSTKSANIEDVIEKTQRKIEREPHKKAAHLATLAYLHTIKPKVDYAEAKKCLEIALSIDEQVQMEGQQDDNVSSEFVIRADMLHLEQKRKGKKPLKSGEMRQELELLNKLWQDPVNRARVFGVKGVAFDCFGPKKYCEGVKAFAAARETQPDNFNWLYGEAYLRARCDRQTAKKAADNEQVELWIKARLVGEPRGLTSATFYANFAEAILHNMKHGKQCLELAEKAMDFFLNYSIEKKKLDPVVYIICFKLFRHLNWRQFNTKDRHEDLMKDALKTAACLGDPAFYLDLSYATDNKEKAIEFLMAGKNLAPDPGNHWIELRILELRSDEWDADRILAKFDSLRDTFSSYDKNVSVIEFCKALYLIKRRETKPAMSSCIEAVEANPSLELVSKGKKIDFFQHISDQKHNHEEYLAWYAANVINLAAKLNLESLYKTALSRDASNEFAQEHLGRYYMKTGQFENAAKCFRELPAENDNRRKLLAEAILEMTAAAADLDLLQECLSLGCIDAAPKIFDALNREKEKQDTARRVMDEASNSGSDVGLKPLFFSTQLYELCAEVVATLQDSNSFSLYKTESTSDLFELVKQRIAKFLELDQLMSTVASTRPNDGTADRGNLMRSSRLRLTEQRLEKGSKTQQQMQELNNLIVSVLKESKEVLDRSLAVLLSRCKNEVKETKISTRARKEKDKKGKNTDHYYPHAFNKIKKQLGSDYQKELNKLASDGQDTKAFERNSLIAFLKEAKDFQTEPGTTVSTNTLENVRKCLLDAVSEIDPNFHQQKSTKDIFEFMASREHRILSKEDCWIVRWIYLVNSEKHSAEILVAELDEQLRSDWSRGGECDRTAYDVAHLAAEFAEETWAVFSCEIGAAVCTGVHSTTVVASVGDSRNSENVTITATVNGRDATGARDATGIEHATCVGATASSVAQVSLSTSLDFNAGERDDSTTRIDFQSRGGSAFGDGQRLRGRGRGFNQHFQGRGGSATGDDERSRGRGRGFNGRFQGRGGSATGDDERSRGRGRGFNEGFQGRGGSAFGDDERSRGRSGRGRGFNQYPQGRGDSAFGDDERSRGRGGRGRGVNARCHTDGRSAKATETGAEVRGQWEFANRED